MTQDTPKDYDVGYGKPPREHQFKRGQSGNPKGRQPRDKDTRTVGEHLRDILSETMGAVINGKPTRITKKDGILLKLVNDAISGTAPQSTRTATWILINGGLDIEPADRRPTDEQRMTFIKGLADACGLEIDPDDPNAYRDPLNRLGKNY